MVEISHLDPFTHVQTRCFYMIMTKIWLIDAKLWAFRCGAGCREVDWKLPLQWLFPLQWQKSSSQGVRYIPYEVILMVLVLECVEKSIPEILWICSFIVECGHVLLPCGPIFIKPLLILFLICIEMDYDQRNDQKRLNWTSSRIPCQSWADFYTIMLVVQACTRKG